MAAAGAAMAKPFEAQPLELLLTAGIALTPKNASMPSDKKICVWDKKKNTFTVQTIATGDVSVVRLWDNVEAISLNPVKGLLAIKAPAYPQHLSTRTSSQSVDSTVKLLKLQNMAEPVELVVWLTPTQLGIVTPTAVYHCDASTQGAAPIKVFQRAGDLIGARIASYSTSPGDTWGALIGTAERPELPSSTAMQLHDFEMNESEVLQGVHVAAFSYGTFPGRDAPGLGIAFTKKVPTHGGAQFKLFIKQLGGPGEGCVSVGLFKPAAYVEEDTPVALLVCAKYGLIYIPTKRGRLLVHDLGTARRVFHTYNFSTRDFSTTSNDIVLACASEADGGMYAVTCGGRVLHVTLDETALVHYVTRRYDNLALAMALAKRAHLPFQVPEIEAAFRSLLSSRRFQEAAHAARDCPDGLLRSQAQLVWVLALPPVAGQTSHAEQYLRALLLLERLNARESMALAGRLLAGGVARNIDGLAALWGNGKLQPSAELANVFWGIGGWAEVACQIAVAAETAESLLDLLPVNLQRDSLRDAPWSSRAVCRAFLRVFEAACCHLRVRPGAPIDALIALVLNRLACLKTVSATGCSAGVLAILQHVPGLTSFEANFCPNLRHVPSLPLCLALQSLSLRACTTLANVAAVGASCPALTHLGPKRLHPSRAPQPARPRGLRRPQDVKPGRRPGPLRPRPPRHPHRAARPGPERVLPGVGPPTPQRPGQRHPVGPALVPPDHRHRRPARLHRPHAALPGRLRRAAVPGAAEPLPGPHLPRPGVCQGGAHAVRPGRLRRAGAAGPHRLCRLLGGAPGRPASDQDRQAEGRLHRRGGRHCAEGSTPGPHPALLLTAAQGAGYRGLSGEGILECWTMRVGGQDVNSRTRSWRLHAAIGMVGLVW